ncbi:unnamed protein product [Pedinophyceae sp. YPF-701]|nr:unnamed protein product [Pedinophyceae sp. YPF-701]
MKALILVGGYGTRLRPLTLSVPKPLVEFANVPMVVHQIQALKEAGVDEVVLAINYRPDVMADFIKEWEGKLNIKISVSKEDEPMGTAGPLAIAAKTLDDGSGDPFFVLNSDVICDYPLRDMLNFHKQSGAEGTILVTRVEDPSKYGVVVMDGKGKIDRFVEKPKEFVGDKINAGIYCISPECLKRIPMKPTSIEREVFPAVAADNKLFAFTLPGYWMDVGQPKDYLAGLKLHLECLRAKNPASLSSASYVNGNAIVDPSAKVGASCKIGNNVSVGKECVIEDGVRLENCVVMAGSKIKSFARIKNCIVGWDSTVGQWCVLDNHCVLGADVYVRDELTLNGAVILPHKEIKEDCLEPKIVL